MKHFFIAFVCLCTWLYFGVRYYECNVKKLCDTPVVEETSTPKVVEEKKIEKPLTYLPFLISKNSDTIQIMNEKEDSLQSFFDFLNENQREELIITSYFNTEEKGTDAIKRGENVKTILKNFGINPDRIVLQTQRQDFDFSAEDKFEKAFSYEYQTMSEERINTIDKGIASKILYAGFGSKTFTPDNTLNAYAIELKNYLAKHPTKRVQIIGHTDSNGEAEDNMWYGKERAKSVMQYFISQGIDGEKLSIFSKGETTPIAPNTTLEGQRLNRRIEINITD
ncbi:OmpA family protein [Kordia zhangzhouensis]|uniref:OmpA family protein n=1 Tax=Kordia zhangzhouensis TaxID=1620405 RepID=UPI0012F81A8C|nr:OmpA family protein [Kordia zhangzhouensis]